MKKAVKMLITTILIINIWYIIIRFLSIPIFEGIPSFVLGTLLFIAELLGFFAFIIYIYIFTGKHNINIKTLTDLNGHIPTIDVFICTYNENFNILSKTIISAQNLDYPKDKYEIYVLDDGNRKELKNLCNNFYNVNYIARENNINAKAGNINNALNQTNGEFFTVLDADMICKPNYLKDTIGYFSDENLAFVQTPQTYYNADVYQYNITNKFNNEQDFFMRYIEPARDSRNCVLHIGTNAIFRRKYVEEVGLYPTKSITEDMALGLLLQSKGYNSIFLNKTLVCGLSACTYSDLIKQRDRWCRGNLQVLHNYKKVIFRKLQTKQKLIYLDGVLYWFSGLTKLIFIITPIIYLLTGFTIVNIPPKYLFPLFLIAFMGQILISKIILPKEISSKYFKFFMKGEFYNTVMAPHLSFSILKHYLFSDFKFNVTKKAFAINKSHYFLKLAIPHIILLVFCIISIIVGTLNLGKNIYLDSYLINIFWVLYNIPGLLISLKIAYQPARNLNKETIPVNEKCKTILSVNNINYNCYITGLSEGYVNIELCNSNKFINDFNIKILKNGRAKVKLSNLKLCINNKFINCKLDSLKRVNSTCNNLKCINAKYINSKYRSSKHINSKFNNCTYNINMTLQFENLSYSELNDIMKLFVSNLKPYKYNINF